MPKVIQPQQRVLNCLESPDRDQDWTFVHAQESGALAGAPAALPASFDLREGWWTVGDQGATGSCVGWATADSVVRWHAVKLGKIAQNQRLSVRYVWMAAKETDEFNTRPTSFIESDGTSLKAALDVCRKFGAVLDALVPFATGKLYPGDANTFYAIAANLKIASYFNLGPSPIMPDPTFWWRVWLATKGPVMTRLNVDATWDNASNTGGNLDVYQPQTGRGGHAVALVGFTPDRFIVRNSWGTSWGDNGFGYASIAYARAAFTESYGISM